MQLLHIFSDYIAKCYAVYVCITDGAGEYIDSWLMLLEKMTNPKNILESPYTFGSKPPLSDTTVFNPLQYLIQIQKVNTFI